MLPLTLAGSKAMEQIGHLFANKCPYIFGPTRYDHVKALVSFNLSISLFFHLSSQCQDCIFCRNCLMVFFFARIAKMHSNASHAMEKWTLQTILPRLRKADVPPVPCPENKNPLVIYHICKQIAIKESELA